MTGDGQYVLVGVARARERWSSDLARWATSGAAPIEFVKCLTADEAIAQGVDTRDVWRAVCAATDVPGVLR